MKHILVFYLFIIAFQSSLAQNSVKPDFVTLDLEEAFFRKEEVPLSKFLNNLDYVVLEAGPRSFIGKFAKYEVTDEYIVVRDQFNSDQILVFDRNTGKFIKSVGNYGRGPEEYIRFSYIPYDPDNKVLYALNTSWDLLAYNLMNDDVEIIKVPEFDGSYLCVDIMMDDKIFVGYFLNLYGMEKNLLVFFTRDEVLKIFPNHQVLETMSHGVGGLMNNNYTIYRQDNKINFIEVFSDTLFQLTRNSLIPRYYFKMGKYNVTWQTNVTMDHIRGMDYFYMSGIYESTKYLFITTYFKGIPYLGYVDKSNNKVTFCELNGSGESRYKDDISGLLDVRPIDITEKNEMVYTIQPMELLNYLEENPEKAAELRNNNPWINDIDEFSNPVIAIGTFKE
jgi:hypothetical protein